VALARSPGEGTWQELCLDPGAVLLVIRQASTATSWADPTYFTAAIHDAAVLEGAILHLDHPAFVDWNLPTLQPIYQASFQYAQASRSLAERSGRCLPDIAWAAGLLAPLGWLAICAIDAEAADRCRQDPRAFAQPVTVQHQHWGCDQAAIARRLARRWQLPGWLAAVCGHLDLPAETAQSLGADSDVFRVVQLAIALVQKHKPLLPLSVGQMRQANAAALGMTPADLEGWESTLPTLLETAPPERTWEPAAQQPLLAELLRIAADNRRLAEAPVLEHLEKSVDELHRALEEQQASEEARLRGQKLSALAEFAAGAGHEINNPLAVISGQAQYLLGHETEPPRQRALQTIVNQAQRIHTILNELMQFARPPTPVPQVLEASAVMQDVVAALASLAAERGVRLSCAPGTHAVFFSADPKQVHTVLVCLVRNAIEAAPADGWASLRLEMPTEDRLELVVEDSGPGPVEREHMFDPFYSGRVAGRGRGLGLSTAWRLARQQGGDIRFVDVTGGPTRFVLGLPSSRDLPASPPAAQPPAEGQPNAASQDNASATPPETTNANPETSPDPPQHQQAHSSPLPNGTHFPDSWSIIAD
jgi:signal transduction histidine kinase